MTTHSGNVAAEVRAAAARAQVKPYQLANKIGMNQSTLSRRLAGHTEFTVTELVAIAHALNIDPASLLPSAPSEVAS